MPRDRGVAKLVGKHVSEGKGRAPVDPVIAAEKYLQATGDGTKRADPEAGPFYGQYLC